MLQGKVSKHLRIRNSIPESIHCQTSRIVRKLVLRLIVSTELYKISLIKHSLLMIQNVLKLLRILKVHFEMNTMDPHQNLKQIKSQILMLRMQQTFLTTRQICIMMLLVERLQVLSNLMDMMGMVCLSLMNQLLLQQVLLLHHQLMIPYSLKLM